MIFTELNLYDEEIDCAIKKLEDEVLIFRQGGDNWYSTYFVAYDKNEE
jgi:hypothetical protein